MLLTFFKMYKWISFEEKPVMRYCYDWKHRADSHCTQALNPRWKADMNFKIHVPELCLIRFCVRDQTGLLSSDFVGQYTLPFTSLKRGYRWVPLLTQDGCSLDPASLFVFVLYS